MLYTHMYHSPLGSIVMSGDDRGLTGLYFEDQKNRPENLGNRQEDQELPVFASADRWLELYFQGKQPDFTPSLHLETTEFRQAVWEILLTIPYGNTMSYGEIAKILMRQRKQPRMSAQAIGGAVGHNAIALIIPCHRVIGSDGSLTGYAGGLERKAALLRLEGIKLSCL